MISIYQLKPKFQALLRPLTRVLFRLGMTANMVTLFAMFASIALGIFLYIFSTITIYYLSLPFFLFFRMALNAIDGMLAREFHQKSHLGGIYNEIGDIISDSFLFFAFFPLGFSPLLLFSIVILAATSEVIGFWEQSKEQNEDMTVLWEKVTELLCCLVLGYYMLFKFSQYPICNIYLS
ncbi:CDP-alcohol phosphatidyltransferase family protein [Fusobacterium necrophorum]|uniref:CDP-alcohol phosphatidyltransferase family protein n=1 Tax=Fusobacterium necrophorum TaxID=859 RepID=UPI00370DF032